MRTMPRGRSGTSGAPSPKGSLIRASPRPTAKALRAAVACVLLAPSPPLLFMGEEFAASTPFLFFCDFGPDFAAAVTRGRRQEFARFERFSDPSAQAAIPDPNDPPPSPA